MQLTLGQELEPRRPPQISFAEDTAGLYFHGFCIRGFTHLQLENSIFDALLGMRECGGLAVCTVLRRSTRGACVSVGFDVCRRGSWNRSAMETRDDCS